MNAAQQAEAILAIARAMASYLRTYSSIIVTCSVEQVRALAHASGVEPRLSWYAAGELTLVIEGPQAVESANIPLGNEVALLLSAARPAVAGDREKSAAQREVTL